MRKNYTFAVLASLLCLIFGYAFGGYVTHKESEVFYVKEIQARTVTNAALILGGLELMRQGDNSGAITMHEKILCGYLLSIAINNNVEVEGDEYVGQVWSRMGRYVDTYFSLEKNNCWSTDEEKRLILSVVVR